MHDTNNNYQLRELNVDTDQDSVTEAMDSSVFQDAEGTFVQLDFPNINELTQELSSLNINQDCNSPACIEASKAQEARCRSSELNGKQNDTSLIDELVLPSISTTNSNDKDKTVSFSDAMKTLSNKQIKVTIAATGDLISINEDESPIFPNRI